MQIKKSSLPIRSKVSASLIDHGHKQSRRLVSLLALAGLSATLNATLLSTSASAVSLNDVFNNTSDSTASNTKVLPVNQAFNVMPIQKGNNLTVMITVTEGYYTYQDKLKLILPKGVTATPFVFSSAPVYINDPDFGRVAVFEQNVTATTTLTSQTAISNKPATLKWQGCAKAGLCYPPEKINFTLKNLTPVSTDTGKTNPIASTPTADNLAQPNQRIKAGSTAVASTANTTNIATATATNPAMVVPSNAVPPTASAPTNTALVNTQPLPASSALASSASTGQIMAASSSPLTDIPVNYPNTATEMADSQTDVDRFGLANHTATALILLFLAGLGLAFTPCVLPMLPIVANIVARQHNPSAKKGLLLTGGYGLGVATSYGLIGALVAVFGQSLGLMSLLQKPAILLTFAGLFVLLGLYMLDVLPIRLPTALTSRIQRLTQVGENRLGSVTGSFISGFFSALVVSPCVSAPLAGALAGVAAIGNPVLGFFALFVLGIGLSTPLILLGITQGNFMPKAGEWMNWVKTGFALMLFAVALLLVERVVISRWMLVIWALWFAVVAVWAWLWRGRGQLFTKGIALIMSLWTLCLVIGVVSGSEDSWQPLDKLTNHASTSAIADSVTNTATSTVRPAIRITKLSELDGIVARYPNVLVDVTADWCIECRIMEKSLFATPPQTLANWQVVKLDVSETNADSKVVYNHLQVFGPPVLLYFKNGKLVTRQNGEVNRTDFERQLASL